MVQCCFACIIDAARFFRSTVKQMNNEKLLLCHTIWLCIQISLWLANLPFAATHNFSLAPSLLLNWSDFSQIFSFSLLLFLSIRAVPNGLEPIIYCKLSRMFISSMPIWFYVTISNKELLMRDIFNNCFDSLIFVSWTERRFQVILQSVIVF